MCTVKQVDARLLGQGRNGSAWNSKEKNVVSELMTAQELAEVLKISSRQIWRLRSSGKLPPPMNIGRSVRWDTATIREWISQGCPDEAELQAEQGGAA